VDITGKNMEIAEGNRKLFDGCGVIAVN